MATVVKRTRHNITLYVLCISCQNAKQHGGRVKCIFSCPADGVQTSTVVAMEVAFRMQINRNDKHNTVLNDALCVQLQTWQQRKTSEVVCQNFYTIEIRAAAD